MRNLAKLHGIFPLYKPRNITSAECCTIVKRNLIKELNLLEFNPSQLKVGHGGTLDKDATGVLAVGIGCGCKKLSDFNHGSKTYVCHATMGLETETGYLTGNQIGRKSFDHVTQEGFLKALKQFIGCISQVPPVYSALKYKGKRLSDYAYAGEPIPLEKMVPRQIKVFDIQCIMFEPPHFILEISCGGGCYIRSIVKDLAHALNTCAYVRNLERTVHGSLKKENSLDIDSLNYENILTSIESYK